MLQFYWHIREEQYSCVDALTVRVSYWVQGNRKVDCYEECVQRAGSKSQLELCITWRLLPPSEVRERYWSHRAERTRLQCLLRPGRGISLDIDDLR